MPLKIAVLVKQVPDHEALVQVKSGQELGIEERYVCSFFDEIAVETALNLKKDAPDAELTALSAGGRRAVDALRRAMALGIDVVEHLGDESVEKGDSLHTAAVLAARLRALAPDLVLCGKQANDDDMAAVGPMVAELLGLPHVSAVVSLKIDAQARIATVGRSLEGEVWTLSAGLPLVLTAAKGLAEPHVPVVTRVMKAMKAKIPNLPLAELMTGGIEPGGRIHRLGYTPPPTRPAVRMMSEPFPKNVHDLVAGLEKAGVL